MPIALPAIEYTDTDAMDTEYVEFNDSDIATTSDLTFDSTWVAGRDGQELWIAVDDGITTSSIGL